MKTFLFIFAIILYFAAAQPMNYVTNRRYMRALPKALRDDGELEKATPAEVNDEEIIYDKALLKKVVKKIRDDIIQVCVKCSTPNFISQFSSISLL